MSTTLSRRPQTRLGMPFLFSNEPLSTLRDEFDHLLSNWFANNGPDVNAAFSPLLDLSETDSTYEVQADLPGLQSSEIKVQVSDNVLTISGERKYEKTNGKEKKAGATAHFVERYHGSFSRSIVLPGAVKQNKIEAKYHEGVLTVTLPKAEECKPCQIEVKS